MYIVADKGWYKEISERKGKPTHCPYATVHKCPRYYQSVSLLEGTGATKIDKKEDERLLKKWKKSDLWPVIDEHATSIRGSSDKFSTASNYCPEVMFDRFGVFASSLGSFVDELDKEASHNYLKSIDAPRNDARWFWMYVEPLHYTDCGLYSVIDNNEVNKENAPWWRVHIVQLIIGILLLFTGAFIKSMFE